MLMVHLLVLHLASRQSRLLRRHHAQNLLQVPNLPPRPILKPIPMPDLTSMLPQLNPQLILTLPKPHLPSIHPPRQQASSTPTPTHPLHIQYTPSRQATHCQQQHSPGAPPVLGNLLILQRSQTAAIATTASDSSSGIHKCPTSVQRTQLQSTPRPLTCQTTFPSKLLRSLPHFIKTPLHDLTTPRCHADPSRISSACSCIATSTTSSQATSTSAADNSASTSNGFDSTSSSDSASSNYQTDSASTSGASASTSNGSASASTSTLNDPSSTNHQSTKTAGGFYTYPAGGVYTYPANPPPTTTDSCSVPSVVVETYTMTTIISVTVSEGADASTSMDASETETETEMVTSSASPTSADFSSSSASVGTPTA